MDIVLDSNIYRSDFLFRTKDLDVLHDYLTKTNSRIIIPQIIFDEVIGLYRRALNERIAAYKGASGNLNIIITETKDHIIPVNLNIDNETAKYETYILNQLNIEKNDIIPYDNTYLPEVAKRGILRQKPSGDDGQGFRDTIIWLTIKDYCSICHEKQIIFISNNTRDFSNEEKNNLHESLIEECDQKKIKINYYKSIKEFIEKHSIKFNFLNDEWVAKNLDLDATENLIKDELNRKPNEVVAAIRKRTGKNCTGKFSIKSIYLSEFHDPFVYEMADGKLIANIIIHHDVEVDFEYFEGPPDLHATENVWEPHFGNAVSSASLFSSAFLTMTVENEKAVDHALGDNVID